MILKARAEKGAAVVGQALFGVVLAGLGPRRRREVEGAREVVDDGVEHGAGPPLFLKAEPHSTGTTSLVRVGRAQGPGEVGGGVLLVGQVLLHDPSS